MKNEERNLVVQKLHPYIPPTVQTPPSFEAPPLIPNLPRQMATRLAPLALPIVLHDLPQNYAWEIPFYDGDGISQQDNLLIDLMIMWTWS